MTASIEETAAADPQAPASMEETRASDDGTPASRSASRSRSAPFDARAIEAGHTIGRYVVIERLGAGAMGVVYAAFDPELDRKVAVKLLKPRRDDRGSAKARLQREAQALARLSHPNVVGVHDVGEIGDAVFVAMEFVDGATLTSWATERDRHWREVVGVFAQAGRGLIAAHTAGLVHRDFKPDNVMIDHAGRVRVMDFGLARSGVLVDDVTRRTARSTDDASRGLDGTAGSGDDLLDTPLTRTGALMGTPAYMSPEQFAGVEADARSDQFGFCVAAFEALHGARPFAGSSMAALMMAVTEGRLTSARNPAVPTWLRRAIERGLATDPAERWPSMQALVDAMLADPAARRRRLGLGLGLVGIAVAAGVAASTLGDEGPRMCAEMDAPLRAVWTDARRETIRTTFAETGSPFARDAADRAIAGMDAWAETWVAGRNDACEDTRVRAEVSDRLLDKRMACLDRRLAHFTALGRELEEADDAVVKLAVDAVAKLPPVDLCSDLDALVARLPPPDDPALAERARAAEAELARASVLDNTGQWPEGIEMIMPLLEEVEAIGHEPLVNFVLSKAAWLHEKTSDFPRAVELAERAFFGAEALKQVHVAADAARLLAYTIGYDQHEPEAGAKWARHAVALSRATGESQSLTAAVLTKATIDYERGDLDAAEAGFAEARSLMEQGLGEQDRNWASMLNNQAMAANKRGDYDRAIALYAEITRIETETLGPDHPNVAKTLTNTGIVYYGQARWDEARAAWEGSRDLLVRGLGPDHPRVAQAINNLGALAYKEGDYEGAIERYERALQIRRKHLDEDHPDIASAILNIAQTHHRMGDTDRAIELATDALARVERAYGVDAPEVANTHNTMGALNAARGDFDAARHHHQRAVALREKLGPKHPKLALSLTNLADVEEQTGNFETARALLTRALEIRVERLDPGHPAIANSMFPLARIDLELGDAASAVERLEQVVTIRDAKEPDPTDVAWARYWLAKALWARNREGDRARARAVADEATSALDGASGSKADRLDEVRAWVDAHP